MAMTTAKSNAIGREQRGAIEERRSLAECCAEHWYDLARHHPKGWGSYRIPPDYHSKVRTYHAEHNSITGSSAAMCAGY